MRLDNFISDLGLIKRRAVVKEMAEGGHIRVNDQRAKPGHRLKVGDIVEITGRQSIKIRVKKLIDGKSVTKEARTEYFEILNKEPISFEL